MRKYAGLFLLVMLLAVPAFAQDYPKGEIFAGYNYLRVNPGGGLDGINTNGWAASVAGNFKDWLGIEGQFTGNYASPGGVSTHAYTYLFGLKLASRKNEKFTPYVHTLFGGATVGGAGVSENGFAMAFGGGIDYNATDSIAIRVGQFDYVPTHILSAWQHNFSYSAGIVFRFAK
jgi:opacity protein-like surface antigen